MGGPHVPALSYHVQRFPARRAQDAPLALHSWTLARLLGRPRTPLAPCFSGANVVSGTGNRMLCVVADEGRQGTTRPRLVGL
jgi:hypothetical protein